MSNIEETPELTETPVDDIGASQETSVENDSTPAVDADTNSEETAAPPTDDNASMRAEMEDLRRRTDAAEANSRAVQDVYSQTLTAQDKQRQEQAELEAVSSMTPEERLHYQGEIEKRELRQIAENSKVELADQQDRNDFTIMAMENSVAREHKDEVEKRLSDAHDAGFKNVKRATILKDLIGEKVLEGVMNGNTTQVENAKTSQQRSASQPTVGVGDASAEVVDKASSNRQERNDRLKQGKLSSAYQ